MNWIVTTTCNPFVESGSGAIDTLTHAGCRLQMPGQFGPLRGDKLKQVIAEADAVVADLDTFDASVLESASRLKVIARWGVGVDAVDLQTATECGILVTNTPGVLEETVADMAWALLLSAARGIPSGNSTMHQGEWKREWGMGVHGKTLGLVGFGRIAQSVARRAQGFHMKLLAYDPFASGRNNEMNVNRVSLESLLEQSDFISLHAAVTQQSRGMIGAAELKLMKPTAILINTARGALIDESALVRALQQEEIAGAALDAFTEEPLPSDHPLRKTPHTILTPHIASFDHDTGRRISELAAQSVLDAIAGQCPEHLVNREVLKSKHLRVQLR